MYAVDMDCTEEKQHVSNRYYETLIRCMFFMYLLFFVLLPQCWCQLLGSVEAVYMECWIQDDASCINQF
jgi:hypothetical protein